MDPPVSGVVSEFLSMTKTQMDSRWEKVQEFVERNGSSDQRPFEHELGLQREEMAALVTAVHFWHERDVHVPWQP